MLIGHERQIAYLDAVLKNDRLAHAYLFYGPEAVGKLAVARSLAVALHCSRGSSSLGDACQECASCRAIAKDSHPYVVLLDTVHTLVSEKEKRKDIPIDDIRELKRVFSLAPEMGRWRIAIVNDAEKLSREACDALLKLLEEPGKRTLILLVSRGRDLLPQTVISRAQGIRFSLVPEELLRSALSLRTRDQKLCDEVVALAAGRPGLALRFLESREALAEERRILREVTSLFKSGDYIALLRFSGEIAGNAALRSRAVEYTLRILRRALHERARKGNPLPLIERLKEVGRIATILETTNVNPRLALDVLFLAAVGGTARRAV